MSTVHPGNRTLPLRVVAARWEAESVTSFEFASPDGADLPPWEPGAHVDVHLPSGTVRQYSLYGDPADRTRYRIAVLELPQGRGGSVEAHRELRPGRIVHIGLPRTNFALAEAERYVFVAGGIGITPIPADGPRGCGARRDGTRGRRRASVLVRDGFLRHLRNRRAVRRGGPPRRLVHRGGTAHLRQHAHLRVPRQGP